MVSYGNDYTDFSSGFISKDFHGKYSSEKFLTGLLDAKNVVITPEGSILRRPGTHLFKNHDNFSRAITFQVSFNEADILVFEPDGNLRINQDGNNQSILGTGITGLATYEFEYQKIRSTMIIVHRSFAPKILTRDASGTWSLSDWDFKDGPWEAENFDPRFKVRPSGFTSTDNGLIGSGQISARNKVGNLDNWFDDNWVTQGRKMRIGLANTSPIEELWGVVSLDSVDTSQQVFGATVDNEFPLLKQGTGVQTRAWRLSAWYADNYPENIAVFQNKIYFFRDDEAWSTVAGDLNKFSPNLPVGENDTYVVSDDAAISIEALSPNSSKVQWVQQYQGLQIAYDDRISLLNGGSNNAVVTPSSVSITTQNEIKASSIKPTIARYLYFVDTTKTKIYRLKYDFVFSSFLPEEVTDNNRELFQTGIRDMEVFFYPFKMLWVVLEDGRIAVGTMDFEEKEQMAWTYFEIRGTNGTNLDVRQILRVNREREFESKEYKFFMDSLGLLYQFGDFVTAEGQQVERDVNIDSSPYNQTNTYDVEEFIGDSGLSVNAGTVDTDTLGAEQRYIDLTNYANWTSGNGEVTLENDGEISVEFFPSIKFRDIGIVSQQSSHITNRKVLYGLLFNLYKTGDFLYKESNKDKWTNLNLRKVSNPLEDPSSLFTGTKEAKVNSSSEYSLQLEITQDKCQPFQLNSISFDYDMHQKTR